MSCNELALPSIRSVFYGVIANASGCCSACVNITSCETIAPSSHALRSLGSDFTYKIYYPNILSTPPSSDFNPDLDRISVPFSSSLFSYAQDVNSSALVSVARSASFGLASVSVITTTPTEAPSVSAQALGSSSSIRAPSEPVIAGIVVGSVAFSILFVFVVVVIRRIYYVGRTTDATTYVEVESKPNAD